MDEAQRRRKSEGKRRVSAACSDCRSGEWRPEPVPESGWARVTGETMRRVHEAARNYYRVHPSYADRWHDAEIEAIAEAAARYDPDRPNAWDFDAYAARLASNRLIDMHRRIFGRGGRPRGHRVESRQRSFTDHEAKVSRRPEWDEPADDFAASIPDPNPCPMLAAADADAFEALMVPLNSRTARVLRLIYREGMTLREIAAITPGDRGLRNVSETTILRIQKDGVYRLRRIHQSHRGTAWNAPTHYYPEGNDGPDAAA